MSDKVIEELDQRISKGNEIHSLLAANPANAYGILAGALTRYAGEVGRLTDEDINRNILARDMAGRVKQTLKLLKDGKFPEGRIEEMKAVLDIVFMSGQKTYNEKMDRYVERVNRIIPDADQ